MPFLRGSRDSFRAGLYQEWSEAPGHRGTPGFEPGKPSEPGGIGPKREGVSRLEKAAECLEGGHRLQVDRKLFAAAIRRPAVNDLETRQVRGRLGGVVARLGSFLELGQETSPSECRMPKQSRLARGGYSLD